MNALYTIGYEVGGQADLLETLRAAGVKTVIDVRELANSRRAGFAKRSLSAGLAATGIDYVHLRALGTPKAGRIANQKGDMDAFWPIVEAALDRPEAGLALEEAAALATKMGPACLLCLEADPERCHRLAVGRRLTRRGFRLAHLHVRLG